MRLIVQDIKKAVEFYELVIRLNGLPLSLLKSSPQYQYWYQYQY